MIHLNRNERRTAIVGILILALWTMHSFVIEPIKARTSTLHRIIPQKQEELSALHDKANLYQSLQSDTAGLQERIAHQDPAFELLPRLEAMLEALQLKNSIRQMDQQTIPLDSAYSENVVEIRLDSITLEQIVAFIQSIETSEALLQTGSMYLTQNPTNQERLNCTLSIHHPRITQQQG
jgi:hypothetical protein